MKKEASKLVLRRETIRAITPSELRDIGGGQKPTFSYIRSSYPMYCCQDTQHTTTGD